jgi:hypothetical protein
MALQSQHQKQTPEGKEAWLLNVKMGKALWRIGEQDAAITIWQNILGFDENYLEALVQVRAWTNSKTPGPSNGLSSYAMTQLVE